MMRKYLFRSGCFGVLGALASSFAMAASVPDGATIRVGAFAFPQAAYDGAEEEAGQLAAGFRNQLISALQQAGLTIVVPSGEKDEEAVPEPEKEEVAGAPQAGNRASSDREMIADADGAEEKDELMAVVEEAERTEKALPGQKGEKQEESGARTGKSGANVSGQPGFYSITGTVTRYDEEVGVPVSTGKTRRSRAEVALDCHYQVRNPSGKVIISDRTSASATRVVPETMDIHAVLQNLKKKAFFEASHNIAERVSGKTRVKGRDDAEPGSADDEYADSPGKRLKSTSGSRQRMKWTIN